MKPKQTVRRALAVLASLVVLTGASRAEDAPPAPLDFPALTCAMTTALPRQAVTYVRFNVEFGPGKMQELAIADVASWSRAAQAQVDSVRMWAEDVQQYSACIRAWRTNFIKALNPVVLYLNSALAVVAEGRHLELGELSSPLQGRGAPFDYLCELHTSVLDEEPTASDLNQFNRCVQSHLQAHEQFIADKKRELARVAQSAAQRIQQKAAPALRQPAR